MDEAISHPESRSPDRAEPDAAAHLLGQVARALGVGIALLRPAGSLEPASPNLS